MDPSLIDRFVTVSDRDSFLMARRVTREEGILVGGSGGTAVYAALQMARELGPDATVVVLLPDSGRGVPEQVLQRRLDARERLPRARRHARRRSPRC